MVEGLTWDQEVAGSSPTGGALFWFIFIAIMDWFNPGWLKKIKASTQTMRRTNIFRCNVSHQYFYCINTVQ